MFSARWQLGIDIQPLQLNAVAVSYARKTWQLQRWWHFLLPEGAVKNGRLYDHKSIKDILIQLRKQIPHNTQTYLALSSQIVGQKVIKLPSENLSPATHHQLLMAQAAKLLMMDKQEVACDFSPMQDNPKAWLMTAVRQQDMDQWLTPFYQTKLRVAAVDIQPMVLQRIAILCGMHHESLYIHCGTETVSWVRCKQNSGLLHFGTLERQGKQVTQIADCRIRAGITDDIPHYTCGIIDDSEATLLPHLPIDDNKMPLPQNYAEWVLALGLATTERTASW